MVRNYLFILKLQLCNRWSLKMDKKFHPTLYNGCIYLSMLGLKLNHFSKMGVLISRSRFSDSSVNRIIRHYRSQWELHLALPETPQNMKSGYLLCMNNSDTQTGLPGFKYWNSPNPRWDISNTSVSNYMWRLTYIRHVKSNFTYIQF